MTDPRIEAAARAMAQEMYGNADAIVGNSMDEWKPAYLFMLKPAEAALAAADRAQLEAMGKLTISEVMKPTDNPFMTHLGVTDLESFGEWLKMKTEGYHKMALPYETGLITEDEADLTEWILSHRGAFDTVWQHWLKAGRAAWRPIEEAPTDGTRIDVRSPEGNTVTIHWTEWPCGYWTTGKIEGQSYTPVRIGFKPTHFQPLPAPPTEETE